MKTYVRPVRWNWWTRNPYYVWYMLREASCVFIIAYALVLLMGLLRLSQGSAAYQGWLESLSHPAAIAFHMVALPLVLYHSWTWFKVMPKTMPYTRVPDRVIIVSGVIAAIVASLVLLALA
jgi:fumarate reductase subunit C